MEKQSIEESGSQRKLQLLASMAEQDPNPIIGLDARENIAYCNVSGKEILLYWQKLYDALPKSLLIAARKSRKSRQLIREEMEIDNKNYLFSFVWVAEFDHVNVYGTDITQLKSKEQEILSLANLDVLTQIANRQYFQQRLEALLKENSITHEPISLLLIDLDNFKMVNDSLGHAMGDKLLQSATKRMARCLRAHDFIARLGGDEFIIILNKTDILGASIVADNINQVLIKPFQFGGYRMEIGCSIGIALYPDTGKSVTELLKHADIAMYQAKKAGKNKSHTFSNQLYQMQYQRDLSIKKDLKFATARNEFYLEYQPQYHLDSKTIFGFEAFLRWDHPKRGLISPNEFLPLAEQTGLIQSIGQWIIEQAISDYTTYLLPYGKSSLSINISLPQLHDARFIDTLCDNIRQNHLSNQQLILDLSENALNAQLPYVLKSLETLHEIGIKLSMDNFGGPKMPLSLLIEMPLDYLKFDNSLLYYLDKRPKQQLLLSGMIGLTHKLGIEVIQKAVEKKEQDALITALDCHYGQGIYYCKPMRLDKLISFLGFK